jgi:hypothetical protein
MDWMKIAVTLPVSHSRRVNCWKCGGEKTASVTNMGKNYVVFCFRCKETEKQDPPAMTAAERLAMRRAADAFEAQEPSLPDDFTLDIPIQGLLWLSKGGLHLDDIKEHGFGWSNTMRRVIMPVMAGSKLVAVQARRVDPSGDGPKYLGQVWSGPRPVFIAGQSGNDITLTEDILSAARVGKVAEAWSLLGTNLMPAVIAQIAERNPDRVNVWMDNDDAGINARRKMLRQLGAVGINARGIMSDRDPKHHTLQEMKELLL